MNADAQNGAPQIAAAQEPAPSPGKIYLAGWVLVALSTAAIGAGCFFYPWLKSQPNPHLEPLSFHFWIGVVLAAAGAGIAAGRRARPWVLAVAAAALLASTIGNVFPYWQIVNGRDRLIRIALIGAMLMLPGFEGRRKGAASWSFPIGCWVFAVSAVLCIATQAVGSIWLQSGLDMFYRNYDVVTLFNSLWSWSYPLELALGLVALLAALAVCLPPLARAGAADGVTPASRFSCP